MHLLIETSFGQGIKQKLYSMCLSATLGVKISTVQLLCFKTYRSRAIPAHHATHVYTIYIEN